jgi:glycosyltransferase involved in cell wall biosynthesis
MMPRVSVITPFVDHARFLAEAIESVRAQTFEDWELILVDDGASDGSRAIADRHAAGAPTRIRVLSPDPKCRGAAAARNRGVTAARGELIAFLDADDVFSPEKLREEVADLECHPEAAMVYSRTRWWHDGLRGRDWTERPGVRTERVHSPPTLLTKVLLDQKGDIPCTCGLLVRKSALDAVGVFEEHFVLYEDQALLAKLFFAYPVYVSKACHARYRQHPSSTSAKAEASGAYDRYRGHGAQDAFYDWLAAYVRERGSDSSVLAALERARTRARRPPPSRFRLMLGYLRRKLPVW